MFTYEANITCSVRDCEAVATGDTCDSPDTARHSAKMQALQNGWLVLSNGSAYCPHHHAESRLCPEKPREAGACLTPQQADLIITLIHSLFLAVAMSQHATVGDVESYAENMMHRTNLGHILSALTKPNT